MKKSQIILIVIGVFIGVFALLRIFHVLSPTEIQTQPFSIQGIVPEIQEENYQLSLIMAGDALYHEGVYKDGYQNGVYDYRKQLELVKPIVSSYDLAYYNQESILGGTELGLSSYPRFNSPYEVGDAFIDAGFNLVSTANNHTLDKGEKAVLNSVKYWQNQKDVKMAGSCDNFDCESEIVVGEKNNITYAFLSYTTSTNGIPVPKGKEYLVNLYSDEKVKSDISKIKDSVDFIIVAMHWGLEYQDNPSKEQKEIANYLASLGVHLVIGNHPHVIEPIEKIDNTYVFYSLGNFISAQTGVDKLVGMLASLKVSKKINGNKKEILIDNIRVQLTYTYYDKSFRNFKIMPFEEVNSSILSQYEKVKEKKETLLQSFGVVLET